MSRVSVNLYDAKIVDIVDALDGVALGASSTVTTSATPTVDELESCVGVLAGKINTILAALRVAGVIKDGTT